MADTFEVVIFNGMPSVARRKMSNRYIPPTSDLMYLYINQKKIKAGWHFKTGLAKGSIYLLSKVAVEKYNAMQISIT